MEKVKSDDGTDIAYWRSGSGPSLLLVHGTTADHTRWPSVLSVFEEHFTVYAMDRRGRGESGDSGSYAIGREVEDIAAVIGAIDGPVYVLGHSYGALCCLEAVLVTDNIEKLILYEPCLHTGMEVYQPGVADRIEAFVEAGNRGEAVAAMFREIGGTPEKEIDILRLLPSWNLRVALAHTIARETRVEEQYSVKPEKFEGVTVPVLLLLGGDSPEHMKRAVEIVHEALPESRIVVMPGQQHIAMSTAPELFSGEVIRFLLDKDDPRQIGDRTDEPGQSTIRPTSDRHHELL